MSTKVITLDYNDLVNGVDLSDQIAEAFGLEGLGALTGKHIDRDRCRVR